MPSSYSGVPGIGLLHPLTHPGEGELRAIGVPIGTGDGAGVVNGRGVLVAGSGVGVAGGTVGRSGVANPGVVSPVGRSPGGNVVIATGSS